MLGFKIKRKKGTDGKYLNRTFLGNRGKYPDVKYQINSYNSITGLYTRTNEDCIGTFTGILYSERTIDDNVKEGHWIFLN